MSTHPTIRLRPKEGRRLRAGAPWAFSNEIEMSASAKALKPGSVVNVEGDDGHALGTGYFNPNSLIAIRLLDARPDVVPDAEFFAARLSAARALRDRVYREPFYRLVHAEGDFLPGLTIDRFGDTYVVQITTAGMEALREPLLKALERRACDAARRHAVARVGRSCLLVVRRRNVACRGAGERHPLFRRPRGRAEDGLVLRPARQPRVHGEPRAGQDGARRVLPHGWLRARRGESRRARESSPSTVRRRRSRWRKNRPRPTRCAANS